MPEGLDPYGDADGANFKDALFYKWERACADKIKAVSEGGKLARHERPESRFVPGTEYVERRGPYPARKVLSAMTLMGFWVAAGASGKPGCPYFGGAVPLSGLAESAQYAAAANRARLRWSRFARWARKQGVKLPRARLYLTETEVA